MSFEKAREDYKQAFNQAQNSTYSTTTTLTAEVHAELAKASAILALAEAVNNLASKDAALTAKVVAANDSSPS